MNECDECAKKFGTKANLVRHRREVHEAANEKPFTCDECEKRFKRIQTLSAHSVKIHGRKLSKLERLQRCRVVGHKRQRVGNAPQTPAEDNTQQQQQQASQPLPELQQQKESSDDMERVDKDDVLAFLALQKRISQRGLTAPGEFS